MRNEPARFVTALGCFGCLLLALPTAGCEDAGGGPASFAAPAAAPTIYAQPASVTVAAGAHASFSVLAAGGASLTYQWRREGVDLVDGPGIVGATAASLSLSASLTLTPGHVSVRVSNAAGDVLSDDALLAITSATPPSPGPGPGTGKAWGAPAQISIGGASTSPGSPDVAIDASGNAIAVWREYVGTPATRNGAWASRYVAGKGWAPAATIDNAAGNSAAPVVALTPSGAAVASFAQSADDNGGVVQLYATRFDGTWGVLTPIGAKGGAPPSEPRVTLTLDGSSMVSFLQTDGTFPRVRVSTGTPGVAWGANAIVDVAGGTFPRVAVAANGHAVVTWVETTGPSSAALWSSRNTGGTWTAPALVAPETGGVSYAIRVVADASGNMTAVWSQAIGARRYVRAARMDDATGAWSAAVSLSDGTRDAYSEDVAADSKGNAVVVWYENGFGVQASRLVASTGTWSSPVTLVTNALGVIKPHVGVDGSGSAMAVWMHRVPNATGQRVYAASMTGAGAWAAPVGLMSDAGAHTEEPPVVAVDESGRAIAVWQQATDAAPAVSAIWASAYR